MLHRKGRLNPETNLKINRSRPCQTTTASAICVNLRASAAISISTSRPWYPGTEKILHNMCYRKLGSLFVAEGLHWVEAGGFDGWPDSKEEADRHGDGNAGDNGPGRDAAG